MTDNFITKIEVTSTKHVRPITIPLSQEKRQHLLITGKNGSGKTSLLNAIDKFLSSISSGGIYFEDLEAREAKRIFPDEVAKKDTDQQMREAIERLGGTKVVFLGFAKLVESVKAKQFITYYFGSTWRTKFDKPRGITKINHAPYYNANAKASEKFLQHIVNLKAQRSWARDDTDDKSAQEVQEIDDWFKNFEGWLRKIFDAPNLQLRFIRKEFDFSIEIEAHHFGFAELSDGYLSVFGIIAELIMRMERDENSSYDMQGIVLIDEIETHLHVDLQKKILPFLIDFFPNIQFIVSTHSPFVLSSVSNAVVCDLESQIVTTDLSGYSYDALIETYFDIDKYSNEIKAKVARYEQLAAKSELSTDEGNEWYELRNYLRDLPKFNADELAVKLQQIDLKNWKPKPIANGA